MSFTSTENAVFSLSDFATRICRIIKRDGKDVYQNPCGNNIQITINNRVEILLSKSRVGRVTEKSGLFWIQATLIGDGYSTVQPDERTRSIRFKEQDIAETSDNIILKKFMKLYQLDAQLQEQAIEYQEKQQAIKEETEKAKQWSSFVAEKLNKAGIEATVLSQAGSFVPVAITHAGIRCVLRIASDASPDINAFCHDLQKAFPVNPE